MTKALLSSSRLILAALMFLSFIAGRTFDLWAGQSFRFERNLKFGPIGSDQTFNDALLINVEVQRVHEVRTGAQKRELPDGAGEKVHSGSWSGLERIDAATPTTLRNILFGIGSSVDTLPARKELIKTWWETNKTRGHVWLDGEAPDYKWQEEGLPEPRVSEDTSDLPYTSWGPRSGLRVARIVLEAYRLGLPDVRWFVMGDDDTIFNTEALATVLAGYDHTEMMYLGSTSETIGQMLLTKGFGMAFGGGGVAISWPLALSLSETMDDCIRRYPEQYGSDSRLRVCSSELGVQLTNVPGFHQFDLRGNVAGFLQAHPLTPFISFHHYMFLDPVFEEMDRVPALRRFTKHMHADPLNFLQSSFCIDQENAFTAVVSWGYSVKLFVAAGRVGDLERAERTFDSFNHRQDENEFSFDTRPVVESYPEGSQCATPVNLWVEDVRVLGDNKVESVYSRKVPANQTECSPHMMARVSEAKVIRDVVPIRASRNGLSRGPNMRRQCCRSLVVDPSWSKIVIELGSCNGLV